MEEFTRTIYKRRLLYCLQEWKSIGSGISEEIGVGASSFGDGRHLGFDLGTETAWWIGVQWCTMRVGTGSPMQERWVSSQLEMTAEFQSRLRLGGIRIVRMIWTSGNTRERNLRITYVHVTAVCVSIDRLLQDRVPNHC